MRTMVTSCCVNFLAARSEICGGVARAAQLVEILGQRVSCGVEFEAEKEGGVRAWGGPGSVACLVSGRDRLGRQVHEACGGRKESGGRLEKATRRSRGGSSSGQLSVRVHAGGVWGHHCRRLPQSYATRSSLPRFWPPCRAEALQTHPLGVCPAKRRLTAAKTSRTDGSGATGRLRRVSPG